MMPIALLVLVVVMVLGLILFLVMREERILKSGAVPQGILEAIWDGTDRRNHPRWLFSCPIRYRIYPNDVREQKTEACAQDASRGGIAARMPERLASGVWLELELMLPQGSAIRAMGEVRWSRELVRAHAFAPREFLTGIFFSKVTDTDVARLLELAQQKGT